MQDPVIAETWMTAFGKDFDGICQGDDKPGKLGTNAMFVMTPSDVPLIPKDRTVTYARVVVNHRPQKAAPNRIWITAGSNLINYPGKLTTCTADVMTAKLFWNSVLSTPKAKYMCLDIIFFTCPPRSTVLNTCVFHMHCSPPGSWNSMPYKTRFSTDTYIWRCIWPCGAFPRQVS